MEERLSNKSKRYKMDVVTRETVWGFRKVVKKVVKGMVVRKAKRGKKEDSRLCLRAEEEYPSSW